MAGSWRRLGGVLAGVYVYEPDGTPAWRSWRSRDAVNVELGGPAGHTLYITAGRSLYRIETTLTGFRLSASAK